MSEESESAARVITVALKELIPIANDGNLPMPAYMLDMALVEAKAQTVNSALQTARVISLDFGNRRN